MDLSRGGSISGVTPGKPPDIGYACWLWRRNTSASHSARSPHHVLEMKLGLAELKVDTDEAQKKGSERRTWRPG